MFEVIPWNYKQITKPGIYSGIPLEKYHDAKICKGPSISSTGLRTIFLKSPKAYWATSPLNPERDESDETKALRFGHAAHHLLFGQAAFDKLYVARPATVNGEAWQSNKSICRFWVSQQKSKGLTVIKPEELHAIVRMSRELANDPAVQRGVLNGYIEHSIFWVDKETGIWLKVRPDAMPNSDLDICDLKTTHSVAWRDLMHSIETYGYDQQAGLVAEACKEVLGQPMQSFSLMFIESKSPHDIEFVTLKDEEIGRGARANRVALRTFADCLAKGKWPGVRGDRAQPKWIELAEYQKERAENRIKFYGTNHD